MGRKKMPLGERLKHYCFVLNLCRFLQIKPRGYQLQKALAQLPKDLGSKDDKRNDKWDRYFYYPDNKTLSADTLTQIEAKFKQCHNILNEPFWEILSAPNQDAAFYYDFLLKTPAAIKKILFDRKRPYELKTNLSPRDFRVVTKQKNLTGLASLLALIKLHQLGAIFISQILALLLEVMLLLKICSTTKPINVVAKECFELTITFMLGDTKDTEKILNINTKFHYLRHLRQLSRIIRTLCLYGSSENEAVLAYWLLRANHEEVISDFSLVDKGVALTENAHGILWALNHAMADVNTRDKSHLQFIFNLFTSDRQLEDQN